MNEIKIKCPTCGKVLLLQDAPNISAASFSCPVCKNRHFVGDCQRYEEPPKNVTSTCDDTRYGSPNNFAPSGDNTICTGTSGQRLGADNTMVEAPIQTTVGRLVDTNGRSYQLGMGLNTIGRKALSSTAMTQIVTDDRTMSRSHAIIEVRRANTQLLHILKNGANKNPSRLNDTVIGVNDQMVLNNGDRLMFGKTLLTFQK